MEPLYMILPSPNDEMFKYVYIQLFHRKTHPLIPQQFVIFEWKMSHFEGKCVILRPVQIYYDNSLSVYDNMHLFEEF